MHEPMNTEKKTKETKQTNVGAAFLFLCALGSFLCTALIIFGTQMLAYHPSLYGVITHAKYITFTKDSRGFIFMLLLASPVLAMISLAILRNAKVSRVGMALMIFIGTFILSVIPLGQSTQTFRHSSYKLVVERMAPLITAINSYHKEQGKYPETLETLVPKYIQTIPTPQMNAACEFNYTAGINHYDDNPWVLSFYVRGWGARDQLIYLPMQNYNTFQSLHLVVIDKWAIRPIH